jgi:predicted transcriptional regulator
MKSKIEGVLHRATIQFNGVTNESLPEFVVKSTDIKHPIRAAFIKVLQDYDGISLDKAVRAEAIDSALGLFAFMEEGDYIENPNDPSAVKDALMKVMSVYGEDEDFIEFLKLLTLQNIYKMSDCSVSAKIAGVIFTKGIQEETLWHSKRGSISTQVRVNIKRNWF